MISDALLAELNERSRKKHNQVHGKKEEHMTNKTFEPLNNYVLIRPAHVADETPGGIVLPANAKETPYIGTVQAVSATVTGVSVGDTVVYPRHQGKEIEFDGTEYKVMDYKELLGVVRG